MPNAVRLLVLVSLLSAAACGVRPGEPGAVLPAGDILRITHAPPGGPDVAAVVDTFYGPSFDPKTFGEQLEGALRRAPDNPDLHEVAAHFARLRGEEELAELHLVKAALDVGAAAPALYLRGLDPNHALVVQACRLIAAGHPNVAARGQARHILVGADRLRNDDSDAEAELEALGVLSQWRVAGSFDNDEGKGFAQRYAPEERVDFAASMPGMLVPIQWRTVPSLGRYGDIDLEDMLWPNRHAVAYAVTFLRVPRAEDAILWLSTNSPVRAWFDGESILSRETVAPNGGDTVAIPLHFAPGPHALLLKSANKNATWFVSPRLTTREGLPIAGLAQSSDPADAPPKPPVDPSVGVGAGADLPKSGASSKLTLPPGFGIRPGISAARSFFLLSRIAVWAGDSADAVRQATAFQAASPGNLVAAYFLATASRANDEQGKALDLLNDGVKRAGATLPRFLEERAYVYMDRSMLEKAQVDAEAFLARRPGDVAAELLLAQVEGRRNFRVERQRTLETAVREHPRHGRALRELAQMRLDDGRVDDARDLLGRARDVAPGSLETLRALTELARRTFHTGDAEHLVATLRERDSTRVNAWLESGDLALQAKHPDQARAYWLAASQRNPDSPQPLARLADLAFSRGDQPEAVRLWTDASMRDPGNALLQERLEHLSPIRLGFIQKYVPTDEEIDAAVAAGTKLTPEEGSQSALLLDDEVAEVHADGSATHVVTLVTRALNDHGRDLLIQAHVPTNGRLKIVKAYALGKNGEQQETASARGGVLRFRNVTVGSTVVLQYIHYASSRQFLPNEFVSDWSFQSVAKEHVLSRWTLVLPAGRPLHVQVAGAVESERKDEAGYQVYRWHAKNVPPLIEEPFAPPLRDLIRRVSVSTVASWDTYAGWERALLAEAFPASAEIGALAKKLTADAKTPREKLDRLTAYVAQEIRYQQDYETTVAGVRPHSSRQVVERAYGDCKDKAVLLIALAREVGVDVEMALLRTLPAGAVERDVPNQQFNHAIAYVPAQPGFDAPFFVDATTDGLDVGSLRADDQGAWSLVLDPRKPDAAATLVPIPYRPAAEQYEKSDVTVRVDVDDTVKVEDHLELRGNDASTMRRMLRNPAYAKKGEEGMAAFVFPASTLVSAKGGDPNELWRPLEISLVIDASKTLESVGTTRRLRWPAISSGLEQLAALSARKLPLRLGVPATWETKVAFDLPPGSHVIDLPRDFEESATCLTIRRKSTAKGTHVDSTVSVVRSCSDVSPADYHAFREHVLSASTRLKEQLAFRVATPPNAKPTGR